MVLRKQTAHTPCPGDNLLMLLKPCSMRAKRKKTVSESTPPPCLQFKHLQRKRFAFWGSPGFFAIPFTTLKLPSGVTLCTAKISAGSCQLSNTLACVDRRWTDGCWEGQCAVPKFLLPKIRNAAVPKHYVSVHLTTSTTWSLSGARHCRVFNGLWYN